MLSRDAVAIVLHSVATGFPDRAVNVIAMSDELDEQERSVLWVALTASNDRAEQARLFGDGLRSLGAPRTLVNEAYRSAFYSSDAWVSMALNPLFAYFAANRGGTPLDKWVHYFPIYENHLARFRGTSARLLEIGVYRGGGLELFRQYLGHAASIVGIDIDASARQAASRFAVEVGDQEDPAFIADVVERHGPFDIVIDDGGHTMRQQIGSVEALFPNLADGGVYIVEDCHTSYWPEFSDPSDPTRTFVAWVKERLDDLNAYHTSVALELSDPWQTDLAAVHAYDSVVVLDKAKRNPPFSEVSGTSDYLTIDRDSSVSHIEILATREAALLRADEAEAEATRQVAAAEARVAAATATADAVTEASRDELRILRAELVAAGQQAARLHTELETAREDLEDATSKLLGSWEIIRSMRQSRSWQLTAPLRRARSIVRRP